MEKKNFDHPVYEHPETGKVLNPITENFITKNYAQQIGVLSEAKEKTAQYFRDIEEKANQAAEKAEDNILNSDDDEEVIKAQDEVEEDKEVIEETDRVEYDEAGAEKRVSHGDSASEKTPDEALESIMSDLDDGDDFEGEDFVDTDAVENDGITPPDTDVSPPDVDSSGEPEDWTPDNMDMPTFPGGVYSTKSRQEKKKKNKLKEMSDGKDPKNKPGTKRAGGPNKRYEHTDSGGIRVIYEDNNDDENN